MKIYIIEGGIGKHVMFTALLPELAKDEQIIIMSSYPDIFENNPYVYRSLSRNTQYQWEDTLMKEDAELFFYEPYYDLDFIKGKKHLIESWYKGLNIKYNQDNLPKLYLHNNIKTEAENFKRQNGRFIIVQFTGSQSPYLYNQNQPFINNGAVKDYSLGQELINKIIEKDDNLKIINYALPNEGFQLENIIQLNTSHLMYAGLLEQAESFIAIDSSLQHFSAALNKKGIVLWGATNPKSLGYKHNINLTNECKLNNLHCNKPYVRELGDYTGSGQRWQCPDPECIKIDPNIIVEELFKIIGK